MAIVAQSAVSKAAVEVIHPFAVAAVINAWKALIAAVDHVTFP